MPAQYPSRPPSPSFCVSGVDAWSLLDRSLCPLPDPSQFEEAKRVMHPIPQSISIPGRSRSLSVSSKRSSSGVQQRSRTISPVSFHSRSSTSSYISSAASPFTNKLYATSDSSLDLDDVPLPRCLDNSPSCKHSEWHDMPDRTLFTQHLSAAARNEALIESRQETSSSLSPVHDNPSSFPVRPPSLDSHSAEEYPHPPAESQKRFSTEFGFGSQSSLANDILAPLHHLLPSTSPLSSTSDLGSTISKESLLLTMYEDVGPDNPSVYRLDFPRPPEHNLPPKCSLPSLPSGAHHTEDKNAPGHVDVPSCLTSPTSPQFSLGGSSSGAVPCTSTDPEAEIVFGSDDILQFESTSPFVKAGTPPAFCAAVATESRTPSHFTETEAVTEINDTVRAVKSKRRYAMSVATDTASLINKGKLSTRKSLATFRCPPSSPVSPRMKPSEKRASFDSNKSGLVHPLTRMPRIIRKVASMRSPGKQKVYPLPPPPRPATVSPDYSTALNRLEVSIEKLRTHGDGFKVRERWNYQSTRSLDGTILPTCGRSQTRPPMPPLPVLSRSLSERSPYMLGVNESTQKLAPPAHRSTQSQSNCSSTAPSIMTLDSKTQEGLKSFIDMTPERFETNKGIPKDKMRRLLARASNNVIMWSKGLKKMT